MSEEAKTIDLSETPFISSEVGTAIMALSPHEDEAEQIELTESKISKEELNLKLLELRALVARLRVIPIPGGAISVPNVDPSVSAFLDADILVDLQEELEPELAGYNEHTTTVARISELIDDPNLLAEYAQLYNKIYEQIATAKNFLELYGNSTNGIGQIERIAIVRQLSRILDNLVVWCDNEEQNIHNQVVREGRGYRDSDKAILKKLDGYREKCETKLKNILISDTEAQIQLRRDQIMLDRAVLSRRVPEQVKERQRGLDNSGFITTQSRKTYIEGSRENPIKCILGALRRRNNVELFGPTGTGKTKIAIQAAKVFSGKSPVIVSGEPGLSRYVFLGQLAGSGVRYEGALIKALKEARILIVDEDNRIDPRALAVVKLALGLEVGEEYEHPDTGEVITVPSGFGVIVNRNEHGKHHKDRFPLPPEYRREFTLASFEIGYFTKEEIYDRFLLPRLCNDDGSMDLSEDEVGGSYNEGDRSPLLSLVVAAEMIQNEYMTNKINAVFESGFMIKLFTDWHELHIKTKCTFLEYLEQKLYDFVMRPIDKPSKKKIIEILVKQGFFSDKAAEDFTPKEGESPVEQTELDTWVTGGDNVFNIDPSSPPLTAREVAMLDPFDSRNIEIPDHPLQAEVDNFRTTYTSFCSNKGIAPISFTAWDLESKKVQIVKELKDYVTNSGMDNADMHIAMIDECSTRELPKFLAEIGSTVFPLLAPDWTPPDGEGIRNVELRELLRRYGSLCSAIRRLSASAPLMMARINSDRDFFRATEAVFEDIETFLRVKGDHIPRTTQVVLKRELARIKTITNEEELIDEINSFLEQLIGL